MEVGGQKRARHTDGGRTIIRMRRLAGDGVWILGAGNSRRGGMVDWFAKWWIVVTQGGQTTVLGGLGSEVGPEPLPIVVFLKTSKASTNFGEPK